MLSVFQKHKSTKAWRDGNIVKRLNNPNGRRIAQSRLPNSASFSNQPLPSTVGSYPVVTWLSQGAVGSVFLGEHTALKIPIAIKVIRLGIADDRQRLLTNARNEAEIAARIDHPNIIRVYDCGVDASDGFYIIMEYAELGDLARLKKAQPYNKFNIDFALYAIISVTNALVKIYKHKIVHRDIKLHNIVLTKDGTIKLTDLGLAKYTNLILDHTETGSSFGTPFYMAPEQWEDAKHVDHRADIYALGISFYQLVTGTLPFVGHNSIEIMNKKDKGEFTRPEVLEPNLDNTISDVICKMMARNPEDRHESPEELLQDLQQYQGTRDTDLEQIINSVVSSLPPLCELATHEKECQADTSKREPTSKTNDTQDSLIEEPSLSEDSETKIPSTYEKARGVNVARTVLTVLALITACGLLYTQINPLLKVSEKENNNLRPLVARAADRVWQARSSFNPLCATDKVFLEVSKQTDQILSQADDFFGKNLYEKAFQNYRTAFQLIRDVTRLDVSCSRCASEQSRINELITIAKGRFPDVQKTMEWQKAQARTKTALKLQNEGKFGDALPIFKQVSATLQNVLDIAFDRYYASTEAKIVEVLEEPLTSLNPGPQSNKISIDETPYVEHTAAPEETQDEEGSLVNKKQKPPESQPLIRTNEFVVASTMLTVPKSREPNVILTEVDPINRNLPNQDIGIELLIKEGKQEFTDGEHFSLIVRTDTDCHLAVLCHSRDPDPMILFPNRYNSETSVPAGQFISIPDKLGETNKRGFKFTVRAPFGQDMMEVIACTNRDSLNSILEGSTPISKTPFSSINQSILIDNLRAVIAEADDATKGVQQKESIKWGQTTMTILTKAKY